MVLKLCEGDLFARLIPEGDDVCIEIVSSGGGVERVVASMSCGLQALAWLPRGYGLQVSNSQGDYLVGTPKDDGIQITFEAAGERRTCLISRLQLNRFIANLENRSDAQID